MRHQRDWSYGEAVFLSAFLSSIDRLIDRYCQAIYGDRMSRSQRDTLLSKETRCFRSEMRVVHPYCCLSLENVEFHALSEAIQSLVRQAY
jgi:hypothetical protein